MTDVTQTIRGDHNVQATQIFNRPLDPVDICADKISTMLRRIADIDFNQVPVSPLRPPDIDLKNIKNTIDTANAIEIEKTYACWDEITNAIRGDASGTMATDYNKAAFLLNQLYLAKFQQDFPGFKINALGVYCQNTSAGADDAYLLVHLIHYMYLSCQIGIVP
jgi:hypothetical protein